MTLVPDRVRLAPGLYLLKPRLSPGGSRDPKYASAYTRYRQLARRAAAIEHLGGVCAACGHDGHVSEYHVHHLDRRAKVPGPYENQRGTRFTSAGTSRPYLSDDEIRELEHCALLCARCHAAADVKYDNPYLRFVNVNTGAYGTWEEIAWAPSSR